MRVTRVLLQRNGTALVLKILGGLLSHLLHVPSPSSSSFAQFRSTSRFPQILNSVCVLWIAVSLAFSIPFLFPTQTRSNNQRAYIHSLWASVSLQTFVFFQIFLVLTADFLSPLSPPPLGFDLKSDDGGHCSPVEPVCSGVFRINCEEKASSSSSSTGGEYESCSSCESDQGNNWFAVQETGGLGPCHQ